MTDAPAPTNPPATPPVPATAAGATAVAPAPRRRRIALGVWSLVIALFPVVYFGLGLLFVLVGQGQNGVPGLAEVAYVMFFLGFVVVPASLFVGLVLAIIAVVVDRPLGKALGVAALLVIAAIVVTIVLFLTGSDSPLFWTDF